MVLWDTSPPSSPSAGFRNKVTAPCPNALSLDFPACRAASGRSLHSVTLLFPSEGKTSLTLLALCFCSLQITGGLVFLCIVLRAFFRICGTGTDFFSSGRLVSPGIRSIQSTSFHCTRDQKQNSEPEVPRRLPCPEAGSAGRGGLRAGRAGRTGRTPCLPAGSGPRGPRLHGLAAQLRGH